MDCSRRGFSLILLLASLLASASALANDPFTCGGESTPIYSDPDITVSVCHGANVHMDDAKSGEWQACVDSAIYQHSRRNGSNVEITDCGFTGKQFKVDGDHLLLRHFLTEYPGDESRPFLIEDINIKAGTKGFQYEREFPRCGLSDVEDAVDRIEAEMKRPFNGETYFREVYGGLYALRDCAKSLPGLALAHLREYAKREVFDGEVAETLDAITSEVEVIYGSAVNRSGCDWSKPNTVLNDEKLYFEVCDENRTIRLNGTIVVKPNMPYSLIFPDCPECNMIWSKISPDNKTAVVWIENEKYQRNAWVIDLESGTVKLFIDASEPEGRHFLVAFNGPDKFTIAHAGMGYETDYFYKKDGSAWVNAGKEEVDVQ